jgi:DNA-binding MarR family transcriptional regulator
MHVGFRNRLKEERCRDNIVITKHCYDEPQGCDEDAALRGQAFRLEQVWIRLNRALFAVGQPDEESDPMSALPVAQLRLCSLLYYDSPGTMSHLAESLGVTVSAATQMADRLEKTGIVRRSDAPTHDRRIRCLELTSLGERLMRARQDARVKRACKILAYLPPDDRIPLLEMLESLAVISQEVSVNFDPPSCENEDARAETES